MNEIVLLTGIRWGDNIRGDRWNATWSIYGRSEYRHLVVVF